MQKTYISKLYGVYKKQYHKIKHLHYVNQWCTSNEVVCNRWRKVWFPIQLLLFICFFKMTPVD